MHNLNSIQAGERTHTFNGFTYHHEFSIGESVEILFGFAKGVIGKVVSYNGNNWFGAGKLFVIPMCAVEFTNPITGKTSVCTYREANNYDHGNSQLWPTTDTVRPNLIALNNTDCS